MKKLAICIMVLSMVVVGLAACGSSKPDEVVNDFLTAIKKGDYEKAATYVSGEESGEFNFNELNEDVEGIDIDQFLKALSDTYTFEEPVEVSSEGNNAKVKAKITSVDFYEAMSTTMSEVFSAALEMSFDEQSEAAEEEMEKLMWSKLIEELSAEDAKMETREVTFNLKKNDEGDYKIISDENVMEAILANSDSLEEMLGE